MLIAYEGGFYPLYVHEHIVTDFLKVVLGNGSVNTVNVQKWKLCLSGRMLLLVARQQPAQQ
jgi:hypothetical protein